jgi:multidrug transporter EmrE-like cation transporter
LLYAISFTVWLVILRSVPLAIAYPAAVGATLCGATAVAVIVLGETIGVSQGAGIALILIGIVLIFRGP